MMARYRLTHEGAQRYPGLNPTAWYEAPGEPDDIGGVQLHMHPELEQRGSMDGLPAWKSPQYVALKFLDADRPGGRLSRTSPLPDPL